MITTIFIGSVFAIFGGVTIGIILLSFVMVRINSKNKEIIKEIDLLIEDYDNTNDEVKKRKIKRQLVELKSRIPLGRLSNESLKVADRINAL